MRIPFLISIIASVLIGLSIQEYQAQGQMTVNGKTTGYQVGSPGSKAYTIEGPGYHAQGMQSGTGGSTGYSVSGPGYQAQGQQSGTGTLFTFGMAPEGYKIFGDKGAPMVVAQSSDGNMIMTYSNAIPTGFKIVESKGKPLTLALGPGFSGFQMLSPTDTTQMLSTGTGQTIGTGGMIQVMPGMGQMIGSGGMGQTMGGMTQMMPNIFGNLFG